MTNIKIGEVEFIDDGRLGFTAKIRGEKVLWLNRKGTQTLIDWLKDKMKNDRITEAINDPNNPLI
jgi:hypothetical protein